MVSFLFSSYKIVGTNDDFCFIESSLQEEELKKKMENQTVITAVILASVLIVIVVIGVSVICYKRRSNALVRFYVQDTRQFSHPNGSPHDSEINVLI